MDDSKRECSVCKNPMQNVDDNKKCLTLCIVCANKKESYLRNQLMETLSKRQRSIFLKLLDIIAYRSALTR